MAGFEEILARDYPDLDELALERITSGRSLVGKGGAYKYGREKTRLVLARAIGIFSLLTAGRQLPIFELEEALLQSHRRKRK